MKVEKSEPKSEHVIDIADMPENGQADADDDELTVHEAAPAVEIPSEPEATPQPSPPAKPILRKGLQSGLRTGL